MYNSTLTFYEQQKKEAKNILGKIKHKHEQELRCEREQGFEIEEDLRHQLRRTYHRAKTEKIEKKRRHREMSQRYQQYAQEVHPSEHPQSRPTLRSLRSGSFIGRSETILHPRRSTKRMSKAEKSELDQVINEVVGSMNAKDGHQSEEEGVENNSGLLMVPKQQKRERRDGSSLYQENKTFLPMLELLAKERMVIKNMTKQQERTHSIITQMLLLALARRKNKKLLDALDILIEIDEFFPKKNRQLELLKSVWYLLIAKLHLEIKEDQKKEKAIDLKNPGRTSILGLEPPKKKRNTIVIRSLVSHRNFISRVSIQIKKMKLVHETNYEREANDCSNAVEEDENGKSLVVSRVSENYALSYPQPAVLFPEMEVVNYGVVLVNRDKETNFFPHHYPSSLEGIVDPGKYMNMVCKVNSILVPEKRCFNFDTSLYANYELIFCVFLLFFLVTISVIVYTTRNAPVAMVVSTLAVTVLAIGLLSLKIHLTSKSGLGKLNETYLAVNKILQEWGDLYPRESVKFILSEQVDLILIGFPTSELEEEGSSDDNERGSRKFSFFSSNSKKNTFTTSSTKFYSGMQEVIEDENDSQETSQLQDLKNKLQQNSISEKDSSEEDSSEGFDDILEEGQSSRRDWHGLRAVSTQHQEHLVIFEASGDEEEGPSFESSEFDASKSEASVEIEAMEYESSVEVGMSAQGGCSWRVQGGQSWRVEGDNSLKEVSLKAEGEMSLRNVSLKAVGDSGGEVKSGEAIRVSDVE